jgi:glycosyltransferase involved in cell wall biosynthesis
MDARKGVHVAIDALALLPAEAELTVQGSGDESYAAGLRERAESLGVSGRVRFASAPREELADVYAAADAVLFPVQWEEPWGLVPLEAMAVGRPVIASGTGGSREYLRDGENALVYAPRESAEGLAEAVRRLAADPSLRERLVAGGRPVAARYTEARYNAAIAEAIDHAAALTRGG